MYAHFLTYVYFFSAKGSFKGVWSKRGIKPGQLPVSSGFADLQMFGPCLSQFLFHGTGWKFTVFLGGGRWGKIEEFSFGKVDIWGACRMGWEEKSSRPLIMFIDQKDLGHINHAAYDITRKIHNLERQRVELWVIQTKAGWKKNKPLTETVKGCSQFCQMSLRWQGTTRPQRLY